MVGPAGFCVGCWYFGAEWLGARSGEAAAVVMLPRVAVHASTCRRRYRPTWLPTSGLSYLASVNAGQPVPSHSGGPGRWLGSHAALLRVGNGDYDRRNGHGGICDRRIRMIVERDRRRYAEPRQQVNAAMALSLRDDPMTARLLTELVDPPTTVVRALDRRANADRSDFACAAVMMQRATRLARGRNTTCCRVAENGRTWWGSLSGAASETHARCGSWCARSNNKAPGCPGRPAAIR
jgi:hypothetical protein